MVFQPVWQMVLLEGEKKKVQLMKKHGGLQYILLLAIFVMAGMPLFLADAQETFEDFLKAEEQSYAAFEQQEAEAFERYKEEVMKKWNDFRNSSRREWYDYSEDLNTLSSIDFKDGEVVIETIIPIDSKDTEAEAKENIFAKIKALFSADPVSKDKILDKQVKLASGETVDSKNVDKFIREKVLPQVHNGEGTIKSKDGVERVKIKVSFKLVPNHLKKRAEKYLAIVKRFCGQYNLNVPLVLAIMQTESYFNPRAKSGAPAFGLMQLVPKSGAREAYRHVHKKDKIVKPRYLYVPENNIELGCAYLAKMRDNEFKNIRDKDSQRYCLIASYNTGPGNLSRAITGYRNVSSAVDKINRMEKQDVYSKLKRDLPYEETRDYLEKVETRRENYTEWQ